MVPEPVHSPLAPPLAEPVAVAVGAVMVPPQSLISEYHAHAAASGVWPTETQPPFEVHDDAEA